MTKVDAYTPRSILVRRSVLTFLGIAGACAGLCVLFLSMRSIMDIGGVCASGNTPFEPRVQCPSGVPGLMVGSIFGGLIALGVYAVNAYEFNLTLLAWPALFISLGFNFADYGINPPEGFGDGASAGWIVCAVLFLLMGGVPLVLWIASVVRGHESRVKTRVQSFSQESIRERLRLSAAGGAAPPPDAEARPRNLRVYAIVLQLAGIAGGIYGGIQLFEWVTGSNVSLGFR
jgi:hypothetical protein